MGAGAGKGPLAEEEHSSVAHNNMSCENCSVSFNFFKKKRLCHDCGRHHCSSCLPKTSSPSSQQQQQQQQQPPPSSGSNAQQPRRCAKCRVLSSGNFTRKDLACFKVKDLQLFLNKHSIQTRHCKEKNDLVELALGFSKNSQYFRELEETRRHTQQLQERRRQDDEIFQGPPPQSEDVSEDSSSGTVPPPSSGTTGPDGGAAETEEERSERLRQRQQQEMEEAEAHMANLNMQQGDARPARQLMTLDAVGHQESIEDLTVRELKEILTVNFVNYKGCCEKTELVDRVKRLWEDRQRNKIKEEQSGTEDEDMCKICMDAIIDCVLLECGHMVTCTQCGKQLAECPICRQYVIRVVHIFKA